MKKAYLAIEKDIFVHERESNFWISHNISSERVSSMIEGIIEASKNQFLYIGINAANIDYMPYLTLLRESTNTPILISTTNYTMQEQGKALALGADLFGQISGNPNENFDSVMASINRINDRADNNRADSNGHREPMVKFTAHGNIMMSRSQRQVFVNGKEVALTRTEFDVLSYFMENRNLTLSSEQLYHYAWKEDYDESFTEAVRSVIKRIRKKMSELGAENNIIENVWGVGYRLR
jgi:two-component system response regulator VanR